MKKQNEAISIFDITVLGIVILNVFLQMFLFLVCYKYSVYNCLQRISGKNALDSEECSLGSATILFFLILGASFLLIVINSIVLEITKKEKIRKGVKSSLWIIFIIGITAPNLVVDIFQKQKMSSSLATIQKAKSENLGTQYQPNK